MSKQFYKAIIFINDDHIIPIKLSKAVNDGSVLVIGSGKRELKWSEFSLSKDVIEKVDHTTQFILYSHGFDEQKQASYFFKNDQDKIAIYTSLDIVKKIFSHNFPFAQGGINLHIASCYAGVGAEKVMDETTKQTAEGNWLGNAVFLHGDAITTRTYKSLNVIKAIIDNNELNKFQLLEKFYTETPGDMHALYVPSFSGNKPLWLKTKFIEKSVQQEITSTWKNHHAAIEKFAHENKLEVKLPGECKITVFDYLQKSIAGGVLGDHQELFPVYFGSVDSPTVKTPRDAEAEKLLEDIFSFVTRKEITEENYKELMSIMLSLSLPEKFSLQMPSLNCGIKLSSSYEKFFSKGLDIAKSNIYGSLLESLLLYEHSPSLMLNQILKIKGATCSTLDSAVLFKIINSCKDTVKILKVLLPKLENDIMSSLIKGLVIYSLLKHEDAVEIFELLLPKMPGLKYDQKNVGLLTGEILKPLLYQVNLYKDSELGRLLETKENAVIKKLIKLLVNYGAPLTDEDALTVFPPQFKAKIKSLIDLIKLECDTEQANASTKTAQVQVETQLIPEANSEKLEEMDNAFVCLKQSLNNGGAALYKKVFNADASDDADTQAAKAEIVTAFVSDMFALVGTKITKSQFDELMVTMFMNNTPQNNVTSAHKALFAKVLDIATASYEGQSLFLRMIVDPNLKGSFTQILEIEGVICSDLMIKNAQGFSLFNAVLFNSDNVKILKSLLPKLTNKIVLDHDLFLSLFYGKNFNIDFVKLCLANAEIKVVLNKVDVQIILQQNSSLDLEKLLIEYNIMPQPEDFDSEVEVSGSLNSFFSCVLL